MEKCIFCDLASGDAPARIIHRTARSFAFLPRRCEVRGHTVVAPSRHIAAWPDLAPDDINDLFLATHAVSALLCSRLSASAINVLFAGGPDAGQSVPHFHLHILPRWPGDGVNAWPHLPGYAGDPDELHRILTNG